MGSSNNISDEYARAHIAVLPSYREGLPKSLIEAAACGRPIIATDVPGCREICIENKTGLRVASRSVQDLATALERLAEDPGLRKRLGENGRKLAETVFAENLINDQTISLYKDMLTNSKTGKNKNQAPFNTYTLRS